VEVWISFPVGIVLNNGYRIKKVTAAYAVSCERDICSNNSDMIFYDKVLGMKYFHNHLLSFLFNAVLQVCLRHYEEWSEVGMYKVLSKKYCFFFTN
jgi:hypothetical protein